MIIRGSALRIWLKLYILLVFQDQFVMLFVLNVFFIAWISLSKLQITGKYNFRKHHACFLVWLINLPFTYNRLSKWEGIPTNWILQSHFWPDIWHMTFIWFLNGTYLTFKYILVAIGGYNVWESYSKKAKLYISN